LFNLTIASSAAFVEADAVSQSSALQDDLILKKRGRSSLSLRNEASSPFVPLMPEVGGLAILLPLPSYSTSAHIKTTKLLPSLLLRKLPSYTHISP
jgi:hypothetical protein